MNIQALERTYDNAPDFIQQAGGLLMSLWLFGALTQDVRKVADMIRERDRYRDCLERIARQESGLWGVWATEALKREWDA